jgi:hypothetical protein
MPGAQIARVVFFRAFLVFVTLWAALAPARGLGQPLACQNEGKLIIEVEEAVAALKPSLEGALPGILGDLRAKTGAPHCLPLRVEVVRSLENEIPGALPWRLPHWAVGAASPDERRVVVALHRDGNRQDRRRTLIHELAHMAVSDLARGQPVPRWLNEGLAQYLAGEGGKSHQEELARARAGGLTLPLEGLDVSFPGDQKQAHLAYALSLAAVAKMVTETSLPTVIQVVRDIGDGKSAKSAIEARSGMSLRDWDRRILADIPATHAWALLFQDAGSFWWVGGIALILGGFRLKRGRRKQLENVGNGRLRTFAGAGARVLPRGGRVQEVVGYGVRVEVYAPEAPWSPTPHGDDASRLPGIQQRW